MDMWALQDDAIRPSDTSFEGFEVRALDGEFGTVEEDAVESGSIIVDTGPWILGKKVLLPAGVVDRVDYEHRTVHVHRTKDDIKNAPEYQEPEPSDDHRQMITNYYGLDGPGHRPWS